MAMENGGNAKVNAIFEARLPQSGAPKPTNHADGPTRERFIRDKYERRKFYDPNAFVEFQQPTQRFGTESSSAPAPPTPVGPPSDAARQRMQERSRRLTKSHSTASDDSNDGSGGGATGRSSSSRRRHGGTSSSGKTSSSSTRAKPQIAKAPASAPPPSMDLLDFLTPDPAPTHAGGNRSNDFFGFEAEDSSAPRTASNAAQGGRMPRTRSGETEPRRTRSKEDLGNLLEKKGTTLSEDIMSLYHRNSIHSATSQTTFQSHDNLLNAQQQRGGYDLGSVTSLMGNMNVQQPMQQQAQQPLFGQGGGFGMTQMTPQQQQQMLMMQQQYQQQQLMMLQQQRMMNNPNTMMFQQQQQQQQQQHQHNGNAFGMQQQPSSTTPGYGYGAGPMGSGPSMTSMAAGNQPASSKRSSPKQPAEKEDPFAQFAMNAFR